MRLLCLDHNRVLGDIKKEFEEVKSIDEADAVLLWNDVLDFERTVLEQARRKGKPVFTVQHGRRGSSRHFAPFNQPLLADGHFVWGSEDKRALVEAGHDGKKIHVVGTTIFTHLTERKKHDGINIVFSPEHWDRPIDENIQVRDKLRKLPYNIITKTIDSPSHDGIEFDNVVRTERNSEEHIDKCIEVLSTADLVVGISESTFELLAQAMDIPVVIMEEWEPKAFGGDLRYADGYRRVISDAAKRTSLKDLNKTIKDQLKNPNELQAHRLNASVEEGGIFYDTIKEIQTRLRRAI